VKNESEKLTTIPQKHQAPSSKFQINPNDKNPNSKSKNGHAAKRRKYKLRNCGFISIAMESYEHSDLDFSLEFGIWHFGFFITAPQVFSRLAKRTVSERRVKCYRKS